MMFQHETSPRWPNQTTKRVGLFIDRAKEYGLGAQVLGGE